MSENPEEIPYLQETQESQHLFLTTLQLLEEASWQHELEQAKETSSQEKQELLLKLIRLQSKEKDLLLLLQQQKETKLIPQSYEEILQQQSQEIQRLQQAEEQIPSQETQQLQNATPSLKERLIGATETVVIKKLIVDVSNYVWPGSGRIVNVLLNARDIANAFSKSKTDGCVALFYLAVGTKLDSLIMNGSKADAKQVFLDVTKSVIQDYTTDSAKNVQSRLSNRSEMQSNKHDAPREEEQIIDPDSITDELAQTVFISNRQSITSRLENAMGPRGAQYILLRHTTDLIQDDENKLSFKYFREACQIHTTLVGNNPVDPLFGLFNALDSLSDSSKQSPSASYSLPTFDHVNRPLNLLKPNHDSFVSFPNPRDSENKVLDLLKLDPNSLYYFLNPLNPVNKYLDLPQDYSSLSSSVTLSKPLDFTSIPKPDSTPDSKPQGSLKQNISSSDAMPKRPNSVNQPSDSPKHEKSEKADDGWWQYLSNMFTGRGRANEAAAKKTQYLHHEEKPKGDEGAKTLMSTCMLQSTDVAEKVGLETRSSSDSLNQEELTPISKSTCSRENRPCLFPESEMLRQTSSFYSDMHRLTQASLDPHISPPNLDSRIHPILGSSERTFQPSTSDSSFSAIGTESSSCWCSGSNLWSPCSHTRNMRSDSSSSLLSGFTTLNSSARTSNIGFDSSSSWDSGSQTTLNSSALTSNIGFVSSSSLLSGSTTLNSSALTSNTGFDSSSSSISGSSFQIPSLQSSNIGLESNSSSWDLLEKFNRFN